MNRHLVDTDACLKTIESLRKDTLICSERRKEEKDALKAKIEMLTKENNLLQLKVQACHNTAELLEKEIKY